MRASFTPIRRFGMLCVLLGLAAALRAADPYAFPRATVPYVGDAPPTMDGVMHPAEYQRLAAISGMVSWGSADGSLRTIVPDIQQVVWYLGYDDKYLYISMRSPNPPAIWPLAKTKRNDDGNSILWDDHVEIQIAKDRAKATFGGVGFYKIMANAKAAFNDDWYHNGTPGTEGAWSLAGQVKCHVTKEYWDLEIAADIRAFDVQKLDDLSWVLQLLRADAPGGTYFAGWVGEAWMSWPAFGEVTFSRTAPVCRLLDLGDIVRGDMQLACEVVGQSAPEVPVTVRVQVTDGAGKVIFDEAKTARVTRGTVLPLAFAGALPLTETKNQLEILATYPQEGKDAVCYHFRAPIIKLTPAFYDQHIGPWLAQRPKGDFDWAFAYWPSYGVAKTSVDVDFFGLPEELAAAAAFEVRVTKKGEAAPLATATGTIAKKAGQMVLKGLTLPVGEYTAAVRLLGADGKTVVGTRTMDFVRRTYAWEGNTLGLENKVLPPFTPIKATGNTFEVWGRKYTLGKDGLLSEIIAGGGAGAEKILTAPLSFSAVEGNKTVKVSQAKCTIGTPTDARVDISATGKLGSAGYTLETYLEFDGWYNVKLTLDPGAKAVTFKELALRIPLWKGADTIYMQRAGDVRRGNKFGAIPSGQGLVWKSADLLPYGDWGSFCPIAYLGNGDKGFWWFAEQHRAWTMSEAKSALEVYRTRAGVELRVNLFAAPTKLTAPRTLEFAFLIDPVKQMPDERKWGWGKLGYAHDTFGYRYWGASVDGYENTDADLEAFNRLLTDPDWKMHPEVKAPSNINHNGYFRRVHYPRVGQQQQMMVLYGSTWMTGLGLDAFDTYGGEWLGRTNWTPSPQTEFKDHYNLQETVKWTTPRELSSVGMNFTRSQEDCFTWYHQRLLEKCPVNGTWWDNSSVGTIEDYDPATGEFYTRFNIYTRRRLTKRLNTIGWELNRPPWWINDMHVDWSFNQISWHIENDYYTNNADDTMMDQLPVDEFRALCRIKRGIIHRLATRGPEGTPAQNLRMGRSAVGMCLLHDIGSYTWGADGRVASGMLPVVDAAVDFFNGAEFIGYWRARPLIAIDTPGVYASVYRGKGRALLVVVNERREDLEVAFTLDPRILGNRPITRIADAETGGAFAVTGDGKRAWGELKPGTFVMPERGVRLIVIE